MGTESPDRIVYRVNCVSGNEDISVNCGSVSGTKATASNVDFNIKHHVVMVKKTNQLLTYVDGTLNKDITLSEGVSTINPRVVIGCNYNYQNNFFKGNLYMCKVYTGELNAKEILNKYNNINL